MVTWYVTLSMYYKCLVSKYSKHTVNNNGCIGLVVMYAHYYILYRLCVQSLVSVIFLFTSTCIVDFGYSSFL